MIRYFQKYSAPCVKRGMKEILTAKGWTNMTYSNNVLRLVNEIVRHYSRYNPIDDQHIIDIEDVSDFDLNELAAKIMLEDPCLASEANGPDNPAFETKMLPALVSFMSNSTSKDESIEFIKEWKEGVTNYFINSMNELFQDRVAGMNFDGEKLSSNHLRGNYLNTHY